MSNLNKAIESNTAVETKAVVKASSKKVRKLTPSNQAKLDVNTMIRELLESHDIEVLDGRNDGYGMTEYTLIARLENSDVQVKLITPALKFKGRYVAEEE